MTPRNGRRALLQGETCSWPSENALIPSPFVRRGGTALLRSKWWPFTYFPNADHGLVGNCVLPLYRRSAESAPCSSLGLGKMRAIASRKNLFFGAIEKSSIFRCLRDNVAPVTLPLRVRHPRAVDTQDAYIKQFPRATRGGRLRRLDRCGYASA